jgi:flagellar biogenesis protein FliO
MESIYAQIIRVILVLVAIVAAMFILRRYGDKFKLNLKPRQTPYGLRKADTIHLGFRKFVSVVEIKDRVLIIGTGDKEITLLAQWTREEKDL